MKTDNYLSLCLEQAARSPLHYRHGCIVVRGGKVIGQGYNDYRPGYDGGSLKNGRVAKGVTDGPAIADLKEKLKKQKGKPKEKQQQSPTQQTFVPFEGTGGGHGANTPLSMHSEMMAIHSALSASSTLSSSALSSKKPCFKLPSGDKRKARLRRETIAAYVNAVCTAATSTTKQGAGQPQANNNNVQQEDKERDSEDEDQEERLLDEQQRVKERGRAFQAEVGGEKHHHQKKNQNGKKKGGKKSQYGYQYDRYGQQIQQGSRRQPSASEKGSGHGIRGYDLTNTKSTSTESDAASNSLQHDKHKKDYKRSGKMRTKSNAEPPQPELLLLPKGHTSSSSRSVTDREKHSRLNGADMYVARLGWCKGSAELRATAPNLPPQAIDTPEPSAPDVDGDLDSSIHSQPSTSSSGSGCLHDELIDRNPSPVRTKSQQRGSKLDISTVRASRPCYRCITYMHSVGIKRVFWTNDAGAWEGGKVHDLVDALDSSMEIVVALKDGTGGSGGAGLGWPTGNGVFVTKHEVLMLKRMMGRRDGTG